MIPKSVEFFQSKVHSVPTKSDYQVELERRVAFMAKEKTATAEKAAIAEESSEAVTVPLGDAVQLNDALSADLGAPAKRHAGPVKELVVKLERKEAQLRDKVDDFADRNNKMAGKPVEGTGLIRIPYLLWIGIIFGTLFLVWTGLKIYSAFNPAVALGMQGTRIAGHVLSKGFSQVLSGTERFKSRLSESSLSDEARTEVLELLSHSQASAQDEDIQKVIQVLTRK